VAKAKKQSRARTPPSKEWPEWSEAKKWGFIRSKLRAGWNRWPPKFAVLAAGKRKYEGPNKLQKHEFQCSECGEWFKQKDVEVDHIIPAGQLRAYEDLPAFVERLYCGVDSLRILCKPCHKVITKEQKLKGTIDDQ
jgi:5-methylcytosine-specific restriction endonuclease McrA